MNPKKFALVPKNPPARAPERKPKPQPTTILDPAFHWTPPGTDIRERFKAYGWKPPKPQKPKFGK